MSEVGGEGAPGAETGGAESSEESGASLGGEGQAQGVSAQDQKAIMAQTINELGDADMDKLVTLKINGKEEKVPLKEALKISRLEKVSQAKMQEAAQMQKQFQQVLHMAKTNPRAFLQQTGVDPYEFAEATLAEKFEMMNLSPEQKRLMELEKENKSFKEREENDKKSAQQRAHAEASAKMQGDLEQEIVEAWKDSGLPRHKYFAARISAEMLSSIAQKRAGHVDQALSAKEAAANVKAQVTSEIKDIILSVAKTDPAAAQKMLGDDLLKILRDYDVKRVTGQSASSNRASQQNRPDQKSVSGKNQKSNQPMSEKEWAEYFKRL